MFTQPQLQVDDALLIDRLEEVKKEKEDLLSGLKAKLKCEDEESVRKKLASNKQNSEISVIQEYGDIPEDFCVWVDYRNVLDVLKNFSTEKIFIDFINCNSPFIIKDKERENYLTLLMPQAKKG